MTAISKKVDFDVLDDIVNKYNNTVHKTIKTKPIDVTDDSYAEYNEDFNKKILNLKLVTMLEFQNIKTFLLKDTLLGLILLVTWMVKKLLKVFMKMNWKKLIKKNLE